MRRTFVSMVGLALMVTILVGLKTVLAAQALGWSAEAGYEPADAAPGVGGDGTDPATTDDPAATLGSTPAPGSSETGAGTPTAGPTPAGPTTAGSTAGTPSAGAPAPSQATTTASAPSATYTGAAVAIKSATTPNRPRSGCGSCHTYSISVTITVSGGKITKATAVYSPTPSGESLRDANKANSSLSASILSKQTWNLGPVSGATYSANAWEQSAKDAMTKAGLPV